MRRRTVCVETSVVSYLTARPTADLLAAAWQKITADWWETRRSRFDLYTSDVTIEEAGRGNPEASARRLAALIGIPVLPIGGRNRAVQDARSGGSASGEGPERCASRRRVGGTWRRLPVDLELPASRQRRGQTGDTKRLHPSRARRPRNLHAAGTHGRLGRCPMKSSRSCGGSRTASRGNMDTTSSASPPVSGAGNRRPAGGSWTCGPGGGAADEARRTNRGPGMTNRPRNRRLVVRRPAARQGARSRPWCGTLRCTESGRVRRLPLGLALTRCGPRLRDVPSGRVRS